MEKHLAVITGANGGMGTEITRAVAKAGYRVVMACYDMENAEAKRRALVEDTGNEAIEVMHLDLSSMQAVSDFADQLLQRGERISLLMNNAGTMATDGLQRTVDGLERTVSVNYVGPYLLTRKLLPLMGKGSRIVNMVSCTYAVGKLQLPELFTQGKRGSFHRIPVYSNSKLALTLFTINLARRVREQGIVVNAADPGIVSTDIIIMKQWFDPLTDVLFRPLIRKPAKGAATAISLLLDEDAAQRTGTVNASCKPTHLKEKYIHHVQMDELWQRTEDIVKQWL